MSSYNATRVNPATPVTARMFSRHPLMWADVFAPDYQVPQEHMVAGVVAGQGLSGDGGAGIAYAPTPNGLYNYVDAVGFLHTVGSESMHQIAQHFLDSIRTVDQGEFPIDICKEVYNDYRHYALVRNSKKKQGRIPTVRECLTEGGTPICDLGSGNGRKPYAHWRCKDETGAYIYRGPKTLLLDKIHFGEIKGLVSLSPSQPLSLPAGMVTNMIYKQVDFETENLAFVPKNFLLVSVNSLNQFPPHFVDNFVRNRDGIHMVPQVLKLVAEGKAMQGSDGRITTRVATKRGQEVYVEHAHEFDYAIFPSVGSDDYYKIYVEFSPRVVACVFNEGTHEIVEFAQEAALHSAQFMDKPKRYTQERQPFMPPYKLKYDGHTMLIKVTSDFIVFETAERRIVLETAAGHTSPVPVDIQCEYRAIDGIELVPHTVWLAGRKLIGPVVAKFMRKTKFEIPGFSFLIPEYHDTLEGVVRAMCDTPFPADGFVASGSGFDTAAKIFETIDIRPCDPVVVSVINDHNAPRNTEWLFANVGENLNRVVGCRKDAKMGEARFGDPAHAACPIREFQIRDNLHSVSLKELRTRDDKQVPNTVKRVKMTLPQAKHEGNNLPSLRNLLADSQLSLLRTAGFDV